MKEYERNVCVVLRENEKRKEKKMKWAGQRGDKMSEMSGGEGAFVG